MPVVLLAKEIKEQRINTIINEIMRQEFELFAWLNYQLCEWIFYSKLLLFKTLYFSQLFFVETPLEWSVMSKQRQIIQKHILHSITCQ